MRSNASVALSVVGNTTQQRSGRLVLARNGMMIARNHVTNDNSVCPWERTCLIVVVPSRLFGEYWQQNRVLLSVRAGRTDPLLKGRSQRETAGGVVHQRSPRASLPHTPRDENSAFSHQGVE